MCDTNTKNRNKFYREVSGRTLKERQIKLPTENTEMVKPRFSKSDTATVLTSLNYTVRFKGPIS